MPPSFYQNGLNLRGQKEKVLCKKCKESTKRRRSRSKNGVRRLCEIYSE